MVPRSGSMRPESSLTIVDLPAPFSPSRACATPCLIVKLTSSTASVAPNALLQVMDFDGARGLFRHRCSLGTAARKSRDELAASLRERSFR